MRFYCTIFHQIDVNVILLIGSPNNNAIAENGIFKFFINK